MSMVVLFLIAGAVRLYRLNAPGLLIDRDYTSAILARDFYFQRTASVQEWRKEIAHTTRQNQPILEPPVTELLVSVTYQAVGREQLWLARLLTSSFWLVGGVFLYKAVRTVSSTDAAVFATAYYLLVPLSILLSRSFQPDSLMMMLFLISLFCLIRYYERPTGLKLVVAASISGLTLIYRPLVVFTLFGAFTALAIHQKGTWKRVIDRQYLVFAAISLLPAILYYGYGIAIGQFLDWKVETSFRPYLLLRRAFWEGWLGLAVMAVGHTALIAALLGVPMLRRGFTRALVVGLGIGYIVFGLAFTMHIHTHGYYHAQLIPIVAFAFGPVVTLIANRLKQNSDRWYWRLAVVGALVLAVFFSFLEVRSRVGAQVFESVETAKRIGEIVNHSSRVVYLARYYGLPLQYNGELSGAYWPRKITYWFYRRADERELSIGKRLDALGFSPEYFVITDFAEFDEHHTDLKEYLVGNCSLVAESRQYLIYEACTKPM